MANLSKTRVLFAFTSPRTIEKIIPEVGMLVENFSNKKWSGNSDLQKEFFDRLFKSEHYEAGVYPEDPAFAARDRITRAPKGLGFVDLKPVIKITEAGKELLEGRRSEEIITRQLLKFQLPSPYHKGFPETFFVKPYLELLRLTKDIGSLSKTEIALFFMQLININKYDQIVKKINAFRKDVKSFEGNRKVYIRDCFNREIYRIYAKEIKAEELKTRESDDDSIKKFVQTKRANMFDYADAFVRYLRATKLVTLQKKTYHLIITSSKIEDVNFILEENQRDPQEFSSEGVFKEYLFSSSNINLLNDNEGLLLNKLDKLGIKIEKGLLSIDQLKDKIELQEKEIIDSTLEKASRKLKTYEEYDDIVDVFDRISKKDIPDAPLFLEWNVWRALVMLNYSKKADGNFIIDLDGVPLNTAPGMKPDIEIEYDDFNMIVEVTMSSGQRQYEMENESVPRHFGRAKQEFGGETYCLFIAPKISEGTLAHYFNLNKINTKFYGGKTKIIPISIEQFIEFMAIGKRQKFNDPNKLKGWLENLWECNQSCEDENEWYEHISTKVKNWL